MLYTIHKLPEEPIVIVRVQPPMNARKQIFAIDAEILKLSQRLNTRLYRIDDLTQLRLYQFTLTDALAWFTGSVREDVLWRSQMPHVAVCRPKIARMMEAVTMAGIEVHVPIYPTMQAALDKARAHIRQR